ncbi:YybH family protein [Phenylobacterium deserti]|uniref:DUF4440 domain-containing protein n=1 Tax=Phenylobacterium deserti TaxID=1914756 RepID=A0A328AUV4_9CAUL|nr:DUF4440 domain-containing protein [Phenylobacterium deserti]RAK57334.1 DUF4440 domain-containing protein [Phenylobacterium deserti]
MRWFSALALAALALPLSADAADPAPVIAAERAFAARAAEVGVAQSFVDFMTRDALMFAPGPVKAYDLYAPRLPGKGPKDGAPLLAWWPAFAGIARSDELGFTTGPVESGGKRALHYFTVWKKQPDGSWKWIYDGGVPNDASASPGPDAPVRALGPSDARPLAPAAAFAQVQAAEATLAEHARMDASAAYLAVLAEDGRIQASPLPPAEGLAAFRRELAARAAQIRFTARGGEASQAGDLAWTWGDAAWLQAGEARQGHYVRIWQRRPAGWRLAYDQILEVKPPPPRPQSQPQG